MQILTAAVSGALFAFGLIFSGMIKPSKVIGFRDFTGAWDSTLGMAIGIVGMRTARRVLKISAPLPTADF